MCADTQSIPERDAGRRSGHLGTPGYQGLLVPGALFKELDLDFGLILADAVSLLDLPDQLVALSRNRIQDHR